MSHSLRIAVLIRLNLCSILRNGAEWGRYRRNAATAAVRKKRDRKTQRQLQKLHWMRALIILLEYQRLSFAISAMLSHAMV